MCPEAEFYLTKDISSDKVVFLEVPGWLFLYRMVYQINENRFWKIHLNCRPALHTCVPSFGQNVSREAWSKHFPLGTLKIVKDEIKFLIVNYYQPARIAERMEHIWNCWPWFNGNLWEWEHLDTTCYGKHFTQSFLFISHLRIHCRHFSYTFS